MNFTPNHASPPSLGSSFQLAADGSFEIREFDQKPPFASFLPGIAGREGIPLWCLYVNRGQCVVSFGVRDKDHAIAEFLPATWAYQLVNLQGFRTFCRIDGTFYEPFQKGFPSEQVNYDRFMSIEMNGLSIREKQHRHKLEFEVEYFSLAKQPLAGLVRVTRIKNRSGHLVSLSVLDGLPIVIPAGFTDFGIKKMRRIHEAYASAELLDSQASFYFSRVRVHDEAEVSEVEEGAFFAAWLERDDTLRPLEPIVDPDIVFGNGNDLATPRLFMNGEFPDRKAQVWENRMPCGFAHHAATLEENASMVFVELIGHAPRKAIANQFLEGIKTMDDIQTLRDQSRDLARTVVSPAFTRSSLPAFDAYCAQNFMDNILRGGQPEMLPSRDAARPLNLYARRHGDLERDYNDFIVPDEPLSNGAGNYRDILQNRRHDIFFHPELMDIEIRMFLSLIQADGYNPLAIEGYRWRLTDAAALDPLCPSLSQARLDELRSLAASPFTPGALYAWARSVGMNEEQIPAWLEGILAQCESTLIAHGHEGGYWIDHWTYLVDLLEAYAAIWPDRIREMLLDKADIGWFWDGARVMPRSEKYQLRPHGPIQIHAVQDGPSHPQNLPPVTPCAKLCALCAIKALTFDAQGIGIEMEAGRPGWNDAMNGLPSLFGSSTCETAELARLARWLLASLPDPPSLEFPLEVAEMLEQAAALMAMPGIDWVKANTFREAFRARIYQPASGLRRPLSGDCLKALLINIEHKASQAIEAAKNPETGLAHTYFVAKPVQFHANNTTQTVDIQSFEPASLPLFLEGQVHLMRILEDRNTARQVYRSVRQSPLFDESLRMYKLNETLRDWSPAIGRARTFTRGWFENESVWPHMEYKYLLEILRAGLFEEFFQDASTMLVPFLNPEIYGRSILENSSFIASSVCPDPAARGRGFVARLSGATAEFIHMWLLMTVGAKPFVLRDGVLQLSLAPALPGSWFNTAPASLEWNGEALDLPADSFACAFLGSILLVYVNPERANTFGEGSARPKSISIDGGPMREIADLSAEDAQLIRARQCRTLRVWLSRA